MERGDKEWKMHTEVITGSIAAFGHCMERTTIVAYANFTYNTSNDYVESC